MRITESSTLPMGLPHDPYPVALATPAPDPFAALRGPRVAVSLTPHARTWLAIMESTLSLRHLAVNHPRIANNLAALWETPIRGTEYLMGLVEDSRPSRQGFSEPVQKELHLLRAYRAYELGRIAKTISTTFGRPARA